jgi:hypothetical protein
MFLLGHPELEEVDLGQNRIGDQGAVALATVLTRATRSVCPRLQMVKLHAGGPYSASVGGAGKQVIRDALMSMGPRAEPTQTTPDGAELLSDRYVGQRRTIDIHDELVAFRAAARAEGPVRPVHDPIEIRDEGR